MDDLPVARVPPVRVEMAVCETGDFCKSAEDVLEDDQEDEQEGDHERKQKHADGFCQDERFLREALDQL